MLIKDNIFSKIKLLCILLFQYTHVRNDKNTRFIFRYDMKFGKVFKFII